MGIGDPLALQPAVFLDRDGVINAAVVREGRPYPPSGLAELRILDGAAKAIADLRRAGYACVVVSNQPDLARGITSPASVDAINEAIAAQTGLEHFYICPHSGHEGCDCRKPRPGLLLQAARDLHLDLCASFMVGDRWRDVEAGKNAGVRSIFVDYGYREQQPVGYDWKVGSLAEAATIILTLTDSRQ